MVLNKVLNVVLNQVLNSIPSKLRNAVRPTEEDIEGASFEFWFLVDAEFLLWRQDVEQILTYHKIFGYISYEVTFY